MQRYTVPEELRSTPSLLSYSAFFLPLSWKSASGQRPSNATPGWRTLSAMHAISTSVLSRMKKMVSFCASLLSKPSLSSATRYAVRTRMQSVASASPDPAPVSHY